MHNHLPAHIKEKFQVTYSEYKADGFTLFKAQNQQWGVVKNDSEILIVAQYDSISYQENKRWFIGVNFNKASTTKRWSYFIHSVDGQLKVQTDQYDSISVDTFGHIICKRDRQFGLLNDDLEEVITPKYESLKAISKDLLQAEKHHAFGLIDNKEKIIYDFTISNIFGSLQNGWLIIQENGQFYHINPYQLKRIALPYSHILRASSNTYAAPNKNDLDKFKTVVDGLNIHEDYDIDDFFNLSGKWGIMDCNGEALIAPSYTFIDFFRSTNYYKVASGKIQFELSEEGNWIAKGGKWGVINKCNEVAVPLKFDWIEEISENLFAVNLGGVVYYNDDFQENYWTAKGGKWGVINIEGAVVVPIEYDTLMLNWFRVKDYIFVQKNTTTFKGALAHDVYDFQGNKIEKNKPDYRKHIFYE
ncbi:MAG: WG repeat-containing protein [Thermonemataceae bacterium]